VIVVCDRSLLRFSSRAFIGDGSRFEKASQVSTYLGLVPRVDISGEGMKYGGVPKRGNR